LWNDQIIDVKISSQLKSILGLIFVYLLFRKILNIIKLICNQTKSKSNSETQEVVFINPSNLISRKILPIKIIQLLIHLHIGKIKEINNLKIKTMKKLSSIILKQL
jgi:hypothetical protein